MMARSEEAYLRRKNKKAEREKMRKEMEKRGLLANNVRVGNPGSHGSAVGNLVRG